MCIWKNWLNKTKVYSSWYHQTERSKPAAFHAIKKSIFQLHILIVSFFDGLSFLQYAWNNICHPVGHNNLSAIKYYGEGKINSYLYLFFMVRENYQCIMLFTRNIVKFISWINSWHQPIWSPFTSNNTLFTCLGIPINFSNMQILMHYLHKSHSL